MNEQQQLQKLTQDAFQRLSSPLFGNGLYQVLDNILSQAYQLGKTGTITPMPPETELAFNHFNL